MSPCDLKNVHSNRSVSIWFDCLVVEICPKRTEEGGENTALDD
jgi:hypothetical protein